MQKVIKCYGGSFTRTQIHMQPELLAYHVVCLRHNV